MKRSRSKSCSGERTLLEEIFGLTKIPPALDRENITFSDIHNKSRVLDQHMKEKYGRGGKRTKRRRR